MTGPLAAGDVHVHFRSVSDNSDEYARAIGMLNRQEVEAAGRFVRERDRAAYVAAHALLREALSACEETPAASWSFQRRADGKPVLGARHLPSDLTFNLSHTSGLVACVVSSGRDVGIDVEPINPRVDAMEIASRFFSRHELASLGAAADSDRPARFVEIWTLKEAYLKATGNGLSTPLDTCVFAYGEATALRFAGAHGDGADWQFALFAPAPEYRMSVAARRHPGEDLHITTWRDFVRVEATVIRASVD